MPIVKQKSEEEKQIEEAMGWRDFFGELEQQNRIPSGVIKTVPIPMLDNTLNYFTPMCFSNFVNNSILGVS